ncbi:hypothetical protein [Streptococcus sp. 20-1249]|uniref:hypothetical protein n=1 Tax=Streptococcus hepaticus TaxID=3349163 RepID=UPI003747FCAA
MKKNIKKLLLVLLTSSAVLFSTNLISADSYVYRLYNPRNGEHLYTTDINERDVLFFDHGWGYEGDGWVAPENGTPVYRLYNRGLQNHLYTSDLNEVNVLTSRHGWTKDNNGKPVFYSGGDVNIYRVYNPKLRGLHHWTTDLNEYNVLPRHGWKQEGVKFKGTAVGQQIRTQYFDPNSNIVSGALGNSEWVFLRSEEAAWVAEDALNDPTSEFSNYKNYDVLEFKTSNGATFYSVEFYN